MSPRDRRGGLDGVLVVAKPAGPTSHDIVALVRRLSATRRIGHGGTLDPFASGVLPLFLGRATRLAEYHLAGRKAYRATVCFGESSSTDDIEGERTPADGVPPTREAVEAALGGFVGTILQRPPAHSAVKIGGRRAYALARAGQVPELTPREVTIQSVELLEWDATDPQRPIAVLDVECSAGTYIRALARDLGTAVGSAAYLGSLTRTKAGGFTLDDAVSVDAIRAAGTDGPDRLRPMLRPMDVGLESMPAVVVDPDEARGLAEGRFVLPAAGLAGIEAADEPLVRAVAEDGTLVALARIRAGRLAPEKVLIDRTPGEGRDDAAPPAVPTA